MEGEDTGGTCDMDVDGGVWDVVVESVGGGEGREYGIREEQGKEGEDDGF